MHKNHSILYFIFTISGLSILSKCFGLFREGVIAAYFGMTPETDTYFFIYSIFTSIIAITLTPISISYLPIFVSKSNALGEQNAINHFTKLLQQFFVFSILLVGCVNVIFYIMSTDYSDSLWNMNDVTFYIGLFSIMFFFAGSIQIFSAVLNGIKQYGKFQIATILQNIIVIVFVFIFGNFLGVHTLVYAIMVGYVLQFIYMLYELYTRRKNKIILSREIFSDQDLKSVYKSIIPVALGAETYLVGLTIDKVIGKSLGVEGIVSALNYAGLLYGLVNTVIIMAVVTVYYTEFADLNSKKDKVSVLTLFDEAIVNISFILFPLVVFLSFNANEFVTIVLKRGNFTESSVVLTSLPFAIYILNSPVYAIRSLITRIFYVWGEVKVPMYNGAVYLLLNIVIGFIFSIYWGIGGIAFASLFASLCSCILLFYNLKKYHNHKLKVFLSSLYKILLAAIGGLFMCYIQPISIANNLLSLCFNGLLFFSTYLLILYLLKFDKLYIILIGLKTRFVKIRYKK